jgi:hypothetical protein
MTGRVFIVLAGLSFAACERRDGKIIIDEQQAKESVQHGADKTIEGAKKLGHEVEKAGEKTGEKLDEAVDNWDRKHDENAPKGQGGGPAAKDAGVKD